MHQRRDFARNSGSGPSDKDFYGLLGVGRDSNAGDMKKAYF